MYLPFFIARRYLFAKKSHNVINIISLISAVGIGIGSMALIIILSVYNGFDTLVKSFYEAYQPDFIITPSRGKIFSASATEFEKVSSLPRVVSLQQVVDETVFVLYDDRESIASVKGVETGYGEISGVSANIVEGEFRLEEGDLNYAIVGRQLASNLRLRTRFLSPLELYFPDRFSKISPLNPMASLNEEILYPSGIISLNQEFDQTGIYVPLSVARNLLSYGSDEVTSVEVYLEKGAVNVGDLELEIEKILGADFVVKGTYEQNETLYKMMKAEKFAVYLILFFVIIVISVNIFGSLSMLIIEKAEDMRTYRSFGADDKLLHGVFVLQGWLISAIGAVVGIIVGLILCFIQMEYEVITMPGNYIVDSYPVDIHFADIMITLFGVLFIGYLIAMLPVKLIGSKKA